MIEGTVTAASAAPIETVLRDELAHCDALIGTIAPILRHLLANSEHSVFSDEIIARARGMFSNLAGQLLDATVRGTGGTERIEHDPDQLAALSEALVSQSALLTHVHALALESQLAERIQTRLAIDPVLPPLVQSLIASSDSGIAGLAMALLASQARFIQSQRRMQLPLAELPGDLLHGAIQAMRTLSGPDGAATSAAAETLIKAEYDESRSRLGLIARLVTGMGGGATVALSVSHAGVSMFLTALSLASGQERDLTTIATNEGQLARLALALRASGLKPDSVQEQFATIHPDVELPSGFETLDADRAASLLAGSASIAGQ